MMLVAPAKALREIMSYRSSRYYHWKMRARAHERQRRAGKCKQVRFRNHFHVILIPSFRDYDEQTRSHIWWTGEDYDAFMRSADSE